MLGYVSATELFLRQTIASLVRLCPYIRQHNHNQMIPFGAIEYYGKSLVEQSLTERVSFSEVGSIRKQLKDRLRIEVRDATSLSRSISDFEKLCQLRHALVHAHGVINSSNAALLLGASPHRSHKADIDTQCIQWAAAVTVNLVRDVTLEVIRSTLWLWIEAKYLSGNARSNRHRIAKLIKSLGSKSDADSGRSGTTEVDIRVAIRTVVAQVNGPDALARTSKA